MAQSKAAKGKKNTPTPSKSTTSRGKSVARKAKPKPSTPRLPRWANVDTFIDVVGIAFTLGGLFTALAMLPSDQPSMAQPWLDLLGRVVGVGAFTAPVVMMAWGVWLVARRFVNAPPPPWYRLFGLVLFGLATLGALSFFQQWREPTLPSLAGGVLGYYTARVLELAIGRAGTPLALLFVWLVGILFIFELSFEDIARGVRRLRPTPRPKPPVVNNWGSAPESRANRAIQLPLPNVSEVVEQTREFFIHLREGRRGSAPLATAPASHSTSASEAPTVVLPAVTPEATVPQPETPWQLPPWPTLLEDVVEGDLNANDIRSKVRTIEETLEHFGVPARVVEVRQGPTVTQYGVEPGFIRKRVRGEEREIKVKVAAITNLHNDLALALAAQRIRIEAPVPGHSYVGIEVPNDRANAVTLRSTMEAEEFVTMKAPLKVALGRDVSGNAVVMDLAKAPHLLIAGATGSGKSVCINTIICSLICHNPPDQLKLMMVDPKMVELIGYNGIPHLIVPVVTEIDRVVGLLRWTVNEMERRYKLFSENQARNIQSYNATAIKKGEKPLPYLVLIIDELADLMMAVADQVEAMICRLAQMARATGIHLILATQRPSVDVVTGLIKANFPARIAFAVTSQIDSRVILDRPGAESLLGRGDMLYMSADSSALKRAQGCFVGDREIERINQFWLEQAAAMAKLGSPVASSRHTSSSTIEPMQPVRWEELLGDDESDEEDDMMPQAREIVRKAGSASISMLQRRLRVGYARAARLVDLLEAEGTIGAGEGPGKTREVYREEVVPGSDDDPGYDPSWVDD